MKRGRPKKKHKEVVMPAPKKEVKNENVKEVAPKNENVISDPNETLAYEA